MLVALSQGSAAVLFFVYILAARLLGNSSFGEFTLGNTIAVLLATIPGWGTAKYASILAARRPDRIGDFLAPGLGLTAVLALAYLPLVWGVGFVLNRDSALPWIALALGIDQLAREYGGILRLLCRVHGEFALDTVTVFIERGLMAVAATVALLVSPDPVLLATSFAGGRTLGLVVTNALYRIRVGPIDVRFDLGALSDVFKGGTPIALRRAMANLSFQVDMLLLGAMRAASEVGWYGSVYKLMDGVIMLPTAVTGSLAPTLSASFIQGRRDVVTRLYQRGAKYLLVAGLFLGAAFAVLADPIVAVLYGQDYAPSAAALRLLAPAVVFIFLRRQATEVLDNVDLRSHTASMFAVGLVLNVGLNLWLIPRYGYLGAAMSTVATEAVLMGTMVWVLHRAGYPMAQRRELFATALAFALSMGATWALRESPITATAVGGLVYVGALTALGVWDEKDVLLVRSIVQRGRGAGSV